VMLPSLPDGFQSGPAGTTASSLLPQLTQKIVDINANRNMDRFENIEMLLLLIICTCSAPRAATWDKG
jgi:hypothetical protein